MKEKTKRYNLYYVFAADAHSHELAARAAEKIKRKIFRKILKKYKT